MLLLEKVNPQHTYFNTDVAELDITNQEAVEAFVSENDIDGIVNCAAYTAVDKVLPIPLLTRRKRIKNCAIC